MADPVKLDDDSLERLARMINSNRGSSTPPPNLAGAGAAADQLSSATRGGAAALNTFTSEITKGTATATGLVDTYKLFTNVGVNFGNDALQFRDNIARTRMSVQEYSDVMGKLIPNITALGGTVTDGAKRFGKMSEEFSQTKAADELRQIGYTTKEYNEVLAISLAGRKNIDFQDADSRKKANMAAADLAMEMDKVAQLTGVSRQEQQRTLQEKQGNARVQAAIEQQVRAGGADAAAAYQKMAVQMKGLGLDKLSDEIYSGQALSQKSIAQLNALGPAGNQLRDAINQVRNATDAESRARADAALREAQAAVARQVTSDQSLNQIRYGQGETAEALGEISISARNYANGINEEKERARRAGKEISDQEAAQNLERRARFTQDLASGKAEADAKRELEQATRTGTEAEKAAAAAKLKEVERAKMEAKPTEALILVLNRLNDLMSTAVQTGIAAGKGTLGSPTGQAALGGIVQAAQPGAIVPRGTVDAINQAIASGNWVEAGKKVAEGFVASARNLLKIGTETATNTANAVTAPDKPRYESTPPVSRAGGSPNFDSFLEDFGAGTPAVLHGKEAVVTEDQLKKLVSGIMSESMVSTRQTATETLTTGGGETTTTRVQNEESKAAEKEMEALRVKFGEDWQKRKEVLIEGMAVEDRKFSKVQAALKADVEAQKIKEDYEAKKAELQKRIDEGIRYEVETKQSANEQIKQLATESQEVLTKGAQKETDIKKTSSDLITNTILAAAEKETDIKKTSSDTITDTIRAATEKEISIKEAPKPRGFDAAIEALQKDLIAKGANIKADGILGPLTKTAMARFSDIKAPETTQVKNLSKTIPNEVAQSRAEATKKTITESVAPKQEDTTKQLKESTTLDDLKTELIQLNKTMGEMLSYSSEMVGNIEKQVRATKRMDPNVALRG